MGVKTDLVEIKLLLKNFAKACDSLGGIVEDLNKRVEELEKTVNELQERK